MTCIVYCNRCCGINMLMCPAFSVSGEIRCYCNESGCVSTGYMCKSSLGKCYSMLTYEGDITHSVHGCLDSVKTEDRNLCSGDRELTKRKKSADWPVLLCCKDDMCNYIDSLDINIVVNTKSNGSIQRGELWLWEKLWESCVRLVVCVWREEFESTWLWMVAGYFVQDRMWWAGFFRDVICFLHPPKSDTYGIPFCFQLSIFIFALTILLSVYKFFVSHMLLIN